MDAKPILNNNEVISFNHINYIKIEPVTRPKDKSKSAISDANNDPKKKGIRWTSVYCLDVAGMIPDRLTEKINQS